MGPEECASWSRDPIAWLQSRIGTYDVNNDLEVQQCVLKGLKNIPKRSGRIKTELIDLDLVRGSAFPKPKTQFCWNALTKKGLLKFVLYPLYFTWWRKHLSKSTWVLFLAVYILIILVLSLFFIDESLCVESETLTFTEILSPVALVLALSFIHTQIVSGAKSADHRSSETSFNPNLGSPFLGHENNRRRNGKRGNSISRSTPGRNSIPQHAPRGDDNIHPPSLDPSLQDHFRDGLRLRCPNHQEQPARLEDSGVEDGIREGIIKIPSDGQDEGHDDEGHRAHFAEFVELIPQSRCSEEKRSGNVTSVTAHTREIKKETPVEGLAVRAEQNHDIRTDKPNQILTSTKGEDVLTANIPTSTCSSNSLQQTLQCRSASSDHFPFLRDSSTSSDLGHNRAKPAFSSNRDSTASFTDDEPQIGFLPKLQQHHNRHFLIPPHDDNCALPDSRQRSASPIRRRSASPSRRRSGSPARRFAESKKQKNNRQQMKNLSLDAMTLSSNNSDDDSEDDVIVKSTSPSPLHHSNQVHHHSSLLSNGPTSGSATSLHRWESDDDGGDSEGDSDTSHAPLATRIASPPMSFGPLDNVDPLGDGDVEPSVSQGLGVTTLASTAALSTALKPPTTSGSTSVLSQQGKVSCRIWEGNEVKKAMLSVSDISWMILEKVEKLSFSSDYLLVAMFFSLVSASLPLVFHLRSSDLQLQSVITFSLDDFRKLVRAMTGTNWKERIVIVTCTVLRLILSFLLLFLLSVAERTFKQRLLHAKHFCQLTSARRARSSDLPHFRLNKVQNIKAWLSVRSFLKRRGPTRSVDIIVSVSFLITGFLILLMCIEILKNPETFLDQLYNWEMISWGLVLGFLMLRLITLGSKINKKYRNLSVLLTEQINLYLQMEQKPFKKEQLVLANNVLKLAAELLKELDSPFKISGLAASPLLYNISRVVILSAFSGVLTEMLGFKLKLYKIKIR